MNKEIKRQGQGRGQGATTPSARNAITAVAAQGVVHHRCEAAQSGRRLKVRQKSSWKVYSWRCREHFLTPSRYQGATQSAHGTFKQGGRKKPPFDGECAKQGKGGAGQGVGAVYGDSDRTLTAQLWGPAGFSCCRKILGTAAVEATGKLARLRKANQTRSVGANGGRRDNGGRRHCSSRLCNSTLPNSRRCWRQCIQRSRTRRSWRRK